MQTAAANRNGSTGWAPLHDAALLCEASFVAGAPVPAGTHEAVAVFDPATGERIGQVPALGAPGARETTEMRKKA